MCVPGKDMYFYIILISVGMHSQRYSNNILNRMENVYMHFSQWKDKRMEGRDTLTSWSSILVPGRPTLHLLSPRASHQKGIYRVLWLRAPSLANIIICASGVGQNWPRINKQKGLRTVNKQHIRGNQCHQNET